jgi:heme o synthase
MSALLRACHPEPSAAVTVGSAALAVATGRSAAGVAAVAAAVGASQLAVGWHNDWLDAGRDARTGRRGKPVAAGAVSSRLVGTAAAVAAVATVPLALLSGPAAGLALILGLVSGLAYNWPLKATPFSVLPYVVAFAALAAFIVLGRPDAPTPPWWLLAAGACLGGGAHFANVLSDLDDDARTGVTGLPHRLGAAWSTAVAATLIAATGALLVFGPPGPAPAVTLVGFLASLAILAAGGVVQRRRPASRAAFRAVMVAALVDVALLLFAGTVV